MCKILVRECKTHENLSSINAKHELSQDKHAQHIQRNLTEKFCRIGFKFHAFIIIIND